MQISELFRGTRLRRRGDRRGPVAWDSAYAEALAENGARVTILDLNAAQRSPSRARV